MPMYSYLPEPGRLVCRNSIAGMELEPEPEVYYLGTAVERDELLGRTRQPHSDDDYLARSWQDNRGDTCGS